MELLGDTRLQTSERDSGNTEQTTIHGIECVYRPIYIERNSLYLFTGKSCTHTIVSKVVISFVKLNADM